jgi:hypothetical protein
MGATTSSSSSSSRSTSTPTTRPISRAAFPSMQFPAYTRKSNIPAPTSRASPVPASHNADVVALRLNRYRAQLTSICIPPLLKC